MTPYTEGDSLDDLAYRLREKAVLLDETGNHMGDGYDYQRIERARLRGKAEGVRLALSFVEEYRRG